MKKMNILTVTQINAYVKAYLDENPLLREIYIKGELSGVTKHFKTGHLYFTLKDDSSSIKGVMFSGNAEYLRFEPENGMEVLVRGFITIFERDGSYQINANDMQPTGAGALQVAYEQLKAKLTAEGIFDNRYKKPIPASPKNIAVITSESGAVFHDVCNVLERRYPFVRLTLIPVAVQGSTAVGQIVASFNLIETLCNSFDTVILCRGGGSAEDLWCFNDERIVRSVFSCKTPVISAIGHETDFTLTDFAADLRAPTPSAAAELAVPNIQEMRYRLETDKNNLAVLVQSGLWLQINRISKLKSDLLQNSPVNMQLKNRQKLNILVELLRDNSLNNLDDKRKKLYHLSAMLDSLSPLKILSRGYTYTMGAHGVIRTVKAVQVGELITTKFCDGHVVSRVEASNEEKTKL